MTLRVGLLIAGMWMLSIENRYRNNRSARLLLPLEHHEVFFEPVDLILDRGQVPAFFQHLEQVQIRRLATAFRHLAHGVDDLVDHPGNFPLRNHQIPTTQGPTPVSRVGSQDVEDLLSHTLFACHDTPPRMTIAALRAVLSSLPPAFARHYLTARKQPVRAGELTLFRGNGTSADRDGAGSAPAEVLQQMPEGDIAVWPR